MKNKAIIYDHNCPMCSLYTRGFVKWGLLESNNRIPFASLSQQDFVSQVDWQRAKHEIPLVDLQGGQTMYGLRALIYVLNPKMPWLKSLLGCKPFYAVANYLYNLVSYNRRIIVPAATSKSIGFDCTPDFHLKYRLAFILLAIFSSIVITYAFGQTLNPLLSIISGGQDMLLIAGTGWVMQIMLAFLFLKNRCVDYISHLAVVMLIGVLLLLPAISFSSLTNNQTFIIPLICVLLSSSLMCWKHFIRVRSLNMHPLWTLVWFVVLQSTALFWIYQLYFN